MNQNSKQGRILGITLSSRGIGYAVLEGENTLVDFGRKRFYGNRDKGTMAGIKKIIVRYQPDVLVLQDANKAKGTNRVPRIKELTRKIAAQAKKQKIEVVKISGKELRLELLGNEDGTKYEMAVLMAQRFPDHLASRLPQKRRSWDNEDARMDIFDAVGLIAAIRLNASQLTQVLVTTNLPAIAPTFALVTFTNNQFGFMLSGTTGSNYVVQAATNLVAPVWIPLLTNPAPFSFVDSNAAFGQRFYRVLIAP